MRWLVRLLTMTVVAVAVGVMLVSTAAAAPPVTTNGNPDPTSNAYSPVAWMQVWDPAQVDYVPLKTGDLQTGLRQAGFVLPEQFAALTPKEIAALQKAWGDSDLLQNVFNRTKDWGRVAYSDTANVPVWSATDSDWVAQQLGSKNYKALTAGLKGVVQRIATVITGDYKPPMPDDQWRAWMSPGFAAAFDARPDKRFDWSAVTMSVQGSNAVIEVCDSGVLNWACKATRAAADAVSGVVSFLDDPLGWLTRKTGDAAFGLMGWVSRQANEATVVDLRVSWWIDAYEKGFAVGIVVMLMVLMWQILQRARGKISSADLVESIAVWAPAYLAGTIFGPPLAQFMIRGSSLLAAALVEGITGSTVGSAADSIQKSADSAADGQVIGGGFAALLMLILVVIASFFIFISLAAQAAAVYLSSVVFGIAFAWVVSVRHRGGSMRIPLMFLVIVFSRPLLFLLLGAGMGLVRVAIAQDADSATRNLAMLIMAIVVLSIAAFSPLLLLKFAPVSPTGMSAATGAATAVSDSGMRRAGGMTRLGEMASRGGAKSPSMAQRARDGARRTGGSTGGAGGTGGSGTGGPAPATASAAATGGTSLADRAGSGTAGTGSSATATGQLLGRTRRHGGGTPTSAAAQVARASRGRFAQAAATAGSMTAGAARSGAGVGAGMTASSRRVGQGLAEGIGGDQPW